MLRDRVSTHIFANGKVNGRLNRYVCGILRLEHRVECSILHPVGFCQLFAALRTIVTQQRF